MKLSKSNTRTQEVTGLNDQARDISRQGDFDAALALCLQAIKQFGDDADPLVRGQVARFSQCRRCAAQARSLRAG